MRMQKLNLTKKSKESDEWYTPWDKEPFKTIKSIIDFDLDPCSPPSQLFRIARTIYTAADNGLIQPWHGRVWLNPPYSNIPPWLVKASDHGNCLALLHARQDTQWWREYVWGMADGVAMLTGRVKFVPGKGQKKKSGVSCGQVLIAYGRGMADTLRDMCDQGLIDGQYIGLIDEMGLEDILMWSAIKI